MSDHSPERFLIIQRYGFVIGVDGGAARLYTSGVPAMEMVSTWQVPGARLAADDHAQIFRVTQGSRSHYFPDVTSMLSGLQHLVEESAHPSKCHEILESLAIELFVHEDDPARATILQLRGAVTRIAV